MFIDTGKKSILHRAEMAIAWYSDSNQAIIPLGNIKQFKEDYRTGFICDWLSHAA